MDATGDKCEESATSPDPKCSMIIRYNADTKSRANALYNSLRVDAEPKSVIRELSVDDSILTV